MACNWELVDFGTTGLRVSPLGLAAGYGVDAAGVEHAMDRGVNWLYWGSRRTRAFAEGFRNGTRRLGRERAVLVVQSYSRVAPLMTWFHERALRTLGTDHADVLLLGWWNALPPPRILEAAARLKERGLTRTVIISCHHRPSFRSMWEHPQLDGIMVRYNAAHDGAEREVFPLLPGPEAPRRPGVVAYTATRWGALLDPRFAVDGDPVPSGADCYRFALTHPAVHVCLMGPKDRAQLDEALRAADRGPMSPEELAWMKRIGARIRGGNGGPPRQTPAQMLDRATGHTG